MPTPRPALRTRLILAGLTMIGVLPNIGTADAATPATGKADFIVVLRDGASRSAVAERHGLTMGDEYEAIFNGFAARGGQSPAAVSADPDVLSVVPNRTFHVDGGATDVAPQATPAMAPTEQIVGPTRARVGLLQSPTAKVNGRGPAIDADIAILDTGIDPAHSDLKVAGGYNCTSPDRKAWRDDNGHGTGVAGIAAARDNGIGVVGVAPGARLWSIKILNADESTTADTFFCGLDWLARNAKRIDVANMSFGGTGAPDAECGKTNGDPFHAAICTIVRRGVTVVASAGNSGVDASGILPAAYPEVIAVSAIDGSDGRPGVTGPSPQGAPGVGPTKCAPKKHADRFAPTSNFGPAVAIAAPGVCVNSTFPGSSSTAIACPTRQCYAFWQGTSFSAPFVSGAVALLRARHPDWAPAKIRRVLVAAADPGPIPGDPDGHREGVLKVDTF